MIPANLLQATGPAVMACALLLAGCNQTGNSAVPGTQTGASTPVSMPDGAGCTGQVGRFRAVIENENRVGHVSPSVYRQVDADLSGAEAACAAGRDAEAQRMLAATKARYGYPA